jgi:hypothetical protein
MALHIKQVFRNWALSDFMLRNWNAKKNEIETDMTENKY